jgi:tetratricopeptide (TPR) repeat protein
VEQYRNQTKPIPEIAKELGVNYILEGSGQKSGNKIHLSVQLLRAAKEGHLWGNSYEQEIHFAAEIFDIQRQISEAIATELKAVITPWEKIIIEKIPTKDLDAYDAYLKGQFYWGKLTQNDLETAMKYFELAKEKDPEYALAYAGISDTWIGLAQMGYVAPIEAGAKAQSALIKATELDTTLAQVHYSLALLKYASEWDWGSSELEFQKVFAINPNHAEAHAYYSHLLNIVGRPKEALEQIDIALKLDPFNPLIKAMYGIDLLFLRRYNDAIAISRDALKTDPTNPVALAASTYAFDKTDNYKEALRTGELAYKVIYPAAIHAFSQGNGSTKESYLKTWKRESDALAKQSINLFFNPTDIAYGYIIAGEKNKALEWLEQAYEVRDQNLMYVLLPCYDNLRNEPGFQKLCLKMNLPYK